VTDEPEHRHLVPDAVEGAFDEFVDVTRKSFWPVIAVLAVLVGVNLLTNRLAPGLYLLWAWAGVAVLLLIARADHESWPDLGLGPLTKRALLAALGVVAVVSLVYLIGSLVPQTRSAFADDRVSNLSAGGLVWAAFVRVPFGTVLLEEVAFRGVLLAMLWRRVGVWPGIVASSVAFGLWHILPSLGITTSNEAVGAAIGSGQSARIAAVVATVFFTFLAGLVFCELRRRFDHLIVPMALHWATNGLGFLFAWWIVTGRLG
jgi:membrane protease YdiL (CAAX protease family)